MQTLIFYDGLCGLCDRLVRFLLPRDTGDRLRFAPLQGDLARRELPPLGHDPSDLQTVIAIAGWGSPGQHVLTRSRAVLHALGQVAGPWPLVARVGQLIPRSLADLLYEGIARVRYRVFGRYGTCPIPRPEWRHKFI